MSEKSLSRRALLKGAALTAGAAMLAACQPKVVEVTRVVKETVMTEGQEKIVEKIVKETVVQEKVVEKTVVVEKAMDAVVLRVHWRLGNVRPHYKLRIEEMQEMFPNVKVNSEEFPAGSAEFGPKIGALVSAGVAGDVCWTAIGSGSFQFLAQYNALLSLEDLIAGENYDMSPYMPRVVEGMRMGPNGQGSGNLMAMPDTAHGTYQCLFFNRELMEKEGLPLPPADDNWTREDLLEIAMAATKPDAKVYGFLPITGGFSEIRHTTLAYGGEMISPDGKQSLMESEGVKTGVRWIHDTFFKSKVAPLAQEISGGLNQMFLAQRLVMFQSGTWGIEGIAPLVKDTFKWDMVLMPKGPSGKRGGHLHADGFGILSQSKNIPMAWEFVKLLTNLESAIGYVEVNGLTARLDTYDDPRAQKAQPFWKIIKQSIEEADAHQGPFNLRKQESQTLVSAMMGPLWTGDVQPDDAFFGEISEEWQEFLDKPAG